MPKNLGAYGLADVIHSLFADLENAQRLEFVQVQAHEITYAWPVEVNDVGCGGRLYPFGSPIDAYDLYDYQTLPDFHNWRRWECDFTYRIEDIDSFITLMESDDWHTLGTTWADALYALFEGRRRGEVVVTSEFHGDEDLVTCILEALDYDPYADELRTEVTATPRHLTLQENHYLDWSAVSEGDAVDFVNELLVQVVSTQSELDRAVIELILSLIALHPDTPVDGWHAIALHSTPARQFILLNPDVADEVRARITT